MHPVLLLDSDLRVETGGSMLKPFWRYYGGKYRAAPRYPIPLYPTIVEPFAGAAGYSLRYPDRNVILVERYAIVAGIWRYLIGVSADEIRRIPYVEHVDALPDWVPQEARWLVGFSMNDAIASPRKQLSAGRIKLRSMGRQFEGWSDAKRERIASQVGSIRHWKVIEGDYSCAPSIEAAWFVDPPYQIAGSHYVHRMAHGEYAGLSDWCRLRRGQVIVCENAGATWLPFSPLGAFKSGPATKVTHEVIWTNDAIPEPA